MSARGSRTATEAGFTLIEMLAALAIGAVVIAAMAGLIRTVGLSFERGTRGVASAERVLLAVERLAADFGSARFILRLDAGSGTQAALFTGARDKAIFVTAGHAAIGERDDEMVFLTVEGDRDTTQLVRRRAAFPGAGAPLAKIVPGDPVVLLEGPIDVGFAFADAAPGQAPRWSATWINQPQPPRQVRLIVRDRVSGADVLAPTVFAIRADAPGTCAVADATPACVAPSAGAPAAAPAPPAPRAPL